MATVRSLKIKLVYEDATNRTYTFNGVEATAAATAKAKILDINDGLEAGTANSFKNTFVSANGAPVKMISDARAILTEQEVIYSAN